MTIDIKYIHMYNQVLDGNAGIGKTEFYHEVFGGNAGIGTTTLYQIRDGNAGIG